MKLILLSNNCGSEFSIAKIPASAADLDVGKSWDCTDFGNDATVEEVPNLFKFRSVNGVVVNDGNSAVKAMAFTKRGLSGVYNYTDNIRVLTTIRLLNKDELVVEWARTEKSELGSLVDAKHFASSYLVCAIAE